MPLKSDNPPAQTDTDIRYPKTWPWIAFGCFLIFGLLGGLVSWSAVAMISGAVIGQGVVTVESNVKTVQHLDGGIVAAINVRNGDRVKEGDILIRLDETSARASLGVITARLNEVYAQRARLEAEDRNLPDIVYPNSLMSAVEKDPRVAGLMDAQKSLLVSRRTRQLGEKGLLSQQVDQLGEQINGLNAEHAAKKRQADLISQEITSVKPLMDDGLYTQSRFLSLEREAARLDGEVGKLVGDIARAHSAVIETKLKIAQIDKDVSQTVLTDLREAQSKIAELEEQRVATVDKLNRVDIRAPRAGIIHNIAVHTIGGVVSPASPILEIIPEEDDLIIEVRLAPSDIDQVRIGQSAQVRFAAFDQQSTPALEGRVKKVSAAQLTDRATGTQYFSAIIEIDAAQLVRLGATNRLVPGIPAEVFIETTARTALSYLSKPLVDALALAFRER